MIGRKLLHYEIVEKLGEGGMGVVYKARDTRLSRYVALKFLPPDKTGDAERNRRFVHEAKAASALDHPNIITIHDIEQTDGASRTGGVCPLITCVLVAKGLPTAHLGVRTHSGRETGYRKVRHNGIGGSRSWLAALAFTVSCR